MWAASADLFEPSSRLRCRAQGGRPVAAAPARARPAARPQIQLQRRGVRHRRRDVQIPPPEPAHLLWLGARPAAAPPPVAPAQERRLRRATRTPSGASPRLPPVPVQSAAWIGHPAALRRPGVAAGGKNCGSRFQPGRFRQTRCGSAVKHDGQRGGPPWAILYSYLSVQAHDQACHRKASTSIDVSGELSPGHPRPTRSKVDTVDGP